MPIADRTPPARPELTDDVCTARLVKVMTRAIKNNRVTISRIGEIVANAPGGKAGCLACLGADQAEAVSLLDKLVTLLNAHKATGVADVTNPLS